MGRRIVYESCKIYLCLYMAVFVDQLVVIGKVSYECVRV